MVTTIINTCEQFLLLPCNGCGDGQRSDFWCGIKNADLRLAGWCEQTKKQGLEASGSIRDKVSDWDEFLCQTLRGGCNPLGALLEGLHNGMDPLDLIAPGSRLECQTFQDSLSTWIVAVV